MLKNKVHIKSYNRHKKRFYMPGGFGSYHSVLFPTRCCVILAMVLFFSLAGCDTDGSNVAKESSDDYTVACYYFPNYHP